jgi:hypothetical protein
MLLKQSQTTSRLIYTLNCKLDGNAYCLDAHYLSKKAMKHSMKPKTKLVTWY